VAASVVAAVLPVISPLYACHEQHTTSFSPHYVEMVDSIGS